MEWLRAARAPARRGGGAAARRRRRTSCGSRTSPTAPSASTRPTAGRWSGEAGAFADPFYSPGSDFIGYGNIFTADLITRDLDGEDMAERLEFYNDFYLRTFDFVLSRYDDQYPVFGNAWVANRRAASGTRFSTTPAGCS